MIEPNVKFMRAKLRDARRKKNVAKWLEERRRVEAMQLEERKRKQKQAEEAELLSLIETLGPRGPGL